jgi:hypothetical protein
MSKEITSKFLMGFAFEGAFSDFPENSWFAGLRPGVIYRLDGMNKYQGFGIFSPSIGLSADLGFASGKNADLNSVTAGYNFDFYRNEVFTLGLYNDFSVTSDFERFPVKLGLQSDIFKNYHIRSGVVIPDSYGYMSYTAGAGYSFPGSSLGWSINYAFVYSKDHGASHYAGLMIEYGSPEGELPVTRIVPDYIYISPNNNGVQDNVVFSIDVTDQSRIKGWRLQIVDENDTVVREFKIREGSGGYNHTCSSF